MSIDSASHVSVKVSEGNRRLLILADFLDQLPPERFDYEKWVGLDWQGAPDLSCGTTGCAMGWAPSIPEFQKLGLELRIALTPQEIEDLRSIGSSLECVVVCPPLGVEFDPWDDDQHEDPDAVTFATAQRFFALTRDAAGCLFVPDHYYPGIGSSPARGAHPWEVAEYIRAFVNLREKS